MRFHIFILLLFVLPPSISPQDIPVDPIPGSTLRVRWNEDPPYSMTNSEGKIVGIDVELIQVTLGLMGYKIDLVKMPFARGLEALKGGDIDILPGAFITSERQVYALFSDPGFSSRNVLFITSSALKKWQFIKLSDLTGTGFRLGVQIGVSYGREFELLLKNINFSNQLSPVSERIQLWKMAALGRIDGLIADELTGKYELAQLGLREQILPTPVIVSEVESEPVGVAFSKKTVSLSFVELYNKTQSRMNNDGTTLNILEKYR
ncbi:MAG: hypothetical protein A2Z96_06560 [Spirochaetes bacterium GWB1_48_6]|nr:MAG: hypothetical protein A2Z96_06560 [Spirochaetes bacterium GWB1_48_6]